MNFCNNIFFECYEKCILMRFLFSKMFYHNIVGTDQSYYSERNEKCIDLTTAWTMFFFFFFKTI